MRPAELLALQADLHRRMSSVPGFREVMANSLRNPYIVNNRTVPQLFEGDRFVDRMSGWARHAMAIEVTPHMTDLVTWVAAEMHDTDQVVLDLAPSPYGLVHFEKALRVHDIRGDILHVSWLLWGPVPGVQGRMTGVLHLTDLHDPDGATDRYLRDMQESAPELMAPMDRWIYTGFGALLDGDRVGPPFNDPHPEIVNSDPDWHGDLTGSTNLTRLVSGLWTVMNQPIAVLEKHEPDRATKRRMTRMKIPPQVTVITLRRPDNPHRHDEEGHVEWQHHWLVRGHPRWQAYGPRRSERKLIWVNPHFKGNMDAPLHQSEKVYKVSR